jgi:bacillithiol biosynthesis cysteine-adding enzyme BshC
MFNLKEIKSPNFYYNSLYYDFIFNFDKVRQYYHYDYRSYEDYKKRANDINKLYDNDLRVKIADILSSSNNKLCCSQKTLDNIDLLKDRKTLVVIGGQQPGFLTGPIFIIYKILTIIKLSHYFSKFLNYRVIPLFWNASDDSNLNQVDNFYLLNREVKKFELGLSETTGFKIRHGQRYSNIYISEELVKQKIEEIKDYFSPSTDFTKKILDMLDECLGVLKLNIYYDKENVNLSSFFSVLVTKLFSEYGIVIIDPSDPDLKELALELIKFDIKNYKRIADAVRQSGENLKSEGYHAQILADTENLNFFLDIEGSRQRFTQDNRGFFNLSDYSFNDDDFYEFLKIRVSDISLNVILRPIFQDMILPVLAVICGPGEVSYYAQLKKVYEMLGHKTGIIYPRFSATIIEGKIVKSMGRLGIEYEEFGEEKNKIRKSIISKSLGNNIDALLKNFENDIFLKLIDLKNSINFNTGATGSAFDRIERNFKKEIEVLTKKLYSEFEKSNELIFANLDKIYLNIFPENKLQERIVNIFNYINKYDFKLIDNLYNLVKPFDFFHKLLIVSL